MKETTEKETLSPLQRAALAIKEMRAKLDRIERQQTEPIAIIGMGCRFPGGANDPESFWQLLRNGVDATSEVPPSRWDIDAYYHPHPDSLGKMYARRGGFLDSAVDEFDAQFFDINPREAISLDPQQRLLLEVAWEALENACQAPDKLTNSQTGVFIGICNSDYKQIVINPQDIDLYTGTGNIFSLVAGRLSHSLGLHGPTLVVDTSCSSALISVHLACQSLRNRECNSALAGGVNLILQPEGTIALSRMRALAADGRCKTFDASADGYSRGEGCGVVVLKRLSDAIANGDNILATIRGMAVNHDGPSSGLTVPNGLAQRSVIRDALNNARVKPEEISYVEAHGTGTSLGDPIEVRSVVETLSPGRSPQYPLKIGSVKTNIGHLEPAAGVASLIKVVLAMQHREIPPHLHLHQLNPHISLEGTNLKIATELGEWSVAPEQRRMAGVSSFGMSGTNVHAVLEEAPEKNPVVNDRERPIHILALSAKSETALRALAGRFEDYLESNLSVNLSDVCFAANAGRSHFSYRLAIIAESSEQVCQQLAALAKGSEPIAESPLQQPKIAFVFAGEGSHYLNMGRQLYETQPTFRQVLESCDAILRSYLETPLLEILYPQEESSSLSSLLNQTSYNRAALFALEYALAQLWLSWGIEPELVVGCDIGEYVAACIAGVFSLEDGLKLLVKSTDAGVTFRAPTIGLISSQTGELVAGDVAGDWGDCLGKPVNWAACLSNLRAWGCNLFIEIGPANSLEKQGTPEDFGMWLPSLEKGKPDWQILLESLRTMYLKGQTINWEGCDRDYQRQRLSLPTYPFERQKYWFKPSPLPYQQQKTIAHPLLDRQVRSPLEPIQYESQWNLDTLPLVKDHQIEGMPLVNIAIYLELILAAVEEAFGSKSLKNCQIENITISQSLIFTAAETRTVQIIFSPESSELYSFEIFSLTVGSEDDPSTWLSHVAGRVNLNPTEVIVSEEISLDKLKAESQTEVSSFEFYHQMAARGGHLGPSCQNLERIWKSNAKALGQLKIPPPDELNNNYLLPLGSIDAFFQLLAASFPETLTDNYILSGLDSFRFFGYSSQPLWGKAILHLGDNWEEDVRSFLGDMCLFDEAGTMVAKVVNAKLKRVSQEALQRTAKLLGEGSGSSPSNHRILRGSLSKETLFSVSESSRQEMLEDYLLKGLANVLGVPLTKLNSQQTLSVLIDSLIAFELQSCLEDDLQVKVPLERFFGEGSIAELATFVNQQLEFKNLIIQAPKSAEDTGEKMEEVLL